MDFLFPLPILALAALVAAGTVAEAAASPRVRQRLDDGWRFHRGDQADAWKLLYDDSRWRKVELPHDFSIEDLPQVSAPAVTSLAIGAGAWRFHRGDDAAWKDPNLDDSGWKTVNLPSYWSGHGDQAMHAFGWYRRRITVPPDMRGRDILLLVGKVDDVDETFVNGVKVGGLGSFPPNYQTAYERTRRYTVPAHVLKGDGTDVVAIRCYNGDGEGGLYSAAAAPVRSGPFDAEAEGGGSQGYTLGDAAWYRKTFTLPAPMRGRHVEITFDGVYMNSEVWLNGQPVGKHPYGYTSFHFDLTPYIRFGRERNVLAVKVDSSGRTSRWYSGSGIYRHVWLTVTDPVHVPTWGVSITTPKADSEKATVQIRTTVQNGARANRDTTVISRIVDPGGKPVATIASDSVVTAGGGKDLLHTVTFARPALWSPASPSMYRLVTTLSVAGKPVDEIGTPFGIRTYTIDAERGFVLNGKPIKLRGGCVHHDNGCLGSCCYDRAEERRIELLKAAGFNAIRTSHNPPSPAFLDACDRHGILVMDEAFDCWARGKNPQDYGRFFTDWWKADVASMVLRDQNHPSVVMWSIGNEIPEQSSTEGAERGKMLADYVRQLDPTRPVAQAAYPDREKWSKLDPLFGHLEVCGYNYLPDLYASDHQKHPNRVIAGTESFPQACFESVTEAIDHPYVIGDFVWTALDYLGEAGLGKTVPQTIPAGYVQRLYTVSNCGDLDLCGFRRPPSHYREIAWGAPNKVACFVQALGPDGKAERVEGWGWTDERPSWTWPAEQLEGKPLTVRVYSSCPRARLLLNGKDLGVRDTDRAARFTGTWEVPYEAGELVAVGLGDGGSEVARWTLRTAGKPTSIRLTPDRPRISAEGQDLSFVTVELVDAKGTLNPNADDLVSFSVDGPGKIIAVGNADPRSMESFQQPRHRAYRGRCLVVVKAGTMPGEVRLRATAPGLRTGESVIKVVGINR